MSSSLDNICQSSPVCYIVLDKMNYLRYKMERLKSLFLMGHHDNNMTDAMIAGTQ